MAEIDNTIEQYKKIVHKLNEIRELLREKLIQLKAIPDDDSYPSLNTLMTKVNPEDIDSIINKQLPNIPIDTTEHFSSVQDIHNYLYNSNTALSQANLLLIRKFLFYREYLKYQLSNMGISEYDIKNSYSIKDLIRLLDQIEKIKDTKIECESIVLYVNFENYIDISVLDETNILVDTGILEIYDGNTKIKSYDLTKNEDITLVPTSLGTKEYTFRYINVDSDGKIIKKYRPSSKTISFTVKTGELIADFILYNTNEKSKYYNIKDDITEGYNVDTWDIKINITDQKEESINCAIPFTIYMENEENIIYTGVTNSLGQANITNIKIPYYSSDFVDFKEKAITQYSVATISPPSNEDNILNELSFIKDPTLEEDEITYRRHTYTNNNYLDDLNGCITNIEIVNGQLEYTTFHTDIHKKIFQINNFYDIVKDFVTEIFYNETIDYETISEKKYDYEKEENNVKTFLKLQTNLNTIDYDNINISHLIKIYHTPIKIQNEILTWYKTDSNMPNNLAFIICDELTGEPLTYMQKLYEININGVYDTVNDVIYNYDIIISNLDYGEHLLDITLYEYGDIVCNINVIITILSNFTFPSKTMYYLNDTPEIYYKPKGIPQKDQAVLITDVKNNINGQYYTKETGLIYSIQDWKTPKIYNLTLTAASQRLTEKRTFSYELKKPFTFERTVYKKTQYATYRVTIYDKEHINLNTNTLKSYITVVNNNQEVNYESTLISNQDALIYDITINTKGTNTLNINVNGYTESVTFKIYERIFALAQSQSNLGEDMPIFITSYDPELESITISGDGITQKSFIKNGDTFEIICDIMKAAPNGTTLTVTDNQGITETITIYIPKADIPVSYSMFSTIFFPEEEITAEWQISKVPINDIITIIYNNGSDNNSSINCNIGQNNVSGNIPLINTTGTHTTSITFIGNNNYNSFTKEIEYTVMGYETYVSDIYSNYDDNLTMEMYTGKYNIKELVNNGDLIDGDLKIDIEINEREGDIVVDGYMKEDGDLVLVNFRDIHKYLLNIKMNSQDALVASISSVNYHTHETINDISINEEGILYITSKINENEDDIIMALEINDEGTLICKRLEDI